MRLDQALVARGLFESRAKAQAAVAAGGVRVNGIAATKPSLAVGPEAMIKATAAHPWVGRGALKLVAALDRWPILVEKRCVLDVGASTGGFTQVCLSRGAARIYAVDVGRGQLHPAIASDPRVVSLECTDARALDTVLIPHAPELIVSDVSFIGLAKALPAALGLASLAADLIALVKPQFEVGPQGVGRGGLVRDAALRLRAEVGVRAFLQGEGWRVNDAQDSPITGGEGNVERLLWATKM